jgi:hypothetical protein
MQGSVLIWIDDILVYSKSFEGHLQNLFNIKLNPQKSELFALHIIWCGVKISKDGVSFDPAYVKGLTELRRPETAKQLQHFCLALSTGLEASFQTMPVTWHHNKNSSNSVKG